MLRPFLKSTVIDRPWRNNNNIPSLVGRRSRSWASRKKIVDDSSFRRPSVAILGGTTTTIIITPRVALPFCQWRLCSYKASIPLLEDDRKDGATLVGNYYNETTTPDKPPREFTTNTHSSNNNNVDDDDDTTNKLPLMEQQLLAQQERLESTLQQRLQEYQELDEDADLETLEAALAAVRDVYQDLTYWDQALRCEERLELFWTHVNAPPEAKLKLAHSWYRRGRYHMHMGLPVEAARCYQHALQDYHTYYGPETFHADKGTVLMSLAGVQYARGSHEEALRILREEAEPHFRQHRDEAKPHPDLFKCLQHQGLVLRASEDFTQALERYQQAREFLLLLSSTTEEERQSEEGPRIKLQSIQLDIADMQLALNKLDEALEGYRTIWETDRANRPKDDEQGQAVVPLSAMDGVMLHNIGRIYAEQQQNVMAIQTLRDAVEMKKAWYGPMHPEVAKSYRILGAVYARNPDDRFEALKCFDHCLMIARQEAGGNDNDPDVMLALRNISILQGRKVPRWGDLEKDSTDHA